VISITDGQIFLESELFYSGIRPAINVGISVSRVGGNAQIKAMRQVAGKLRLDLAQYRALAAFAQFASDLDKATQQQLTRGSKLTEVLKQGQYSPWPVEEQVVILWTAGQGFLDEIPNGEIAQFQAEFMKYVRSVGAPILEGIRTKKALDDDLTGKMKTLIEEFKITYAKNHA